MFQRTQLGCHACHPHEATASMPMEKLALLPSLRRQNLLAELYAHPSLPLSQHAPLQLTALRRTVLDSSSLALPASLSV